MSIHRSPRKFLYQQKAVRVYGRKAGCYLSLTVFSYSFLVYLSLIGGAALTDIIGQSLPVVEVIYAGYTDLRYYVCDPLRVVKGKLHLDQPKSESEVSFFIF